MQLSVKKNNGASGVKINRLKNGVAPNNIARTCNRLHNQLRKVTKELGKRSESGSSETSSINMNPKSIIRWIKNITLTLGIHIRCSWREQTLNPTHCFLFFSREQNKLNFFPKTTFQFTISKEDETYAPTKFI